MRRRINRLNGGNRIVAFSSFTGTDGTELSDIATDAGTVWQSTDLLGSPVGQRPTISSNRARARSIAGTSFLWHPRHRKPRNVTVSCDVIRIGTATNSTVGVLARHTNKQGYVAIYNTTAWMLFRRHPSSGNVQLASNVAQALTQDQTYRLTLQVIGPRVIVSVDGAIIINVEDAYLARGDAGIRNGNTNAVACMFVQDNWIIAR